MAFAAACADTVTWKSGASPRNSRDTRIAVDEAPNAAIAIRVSSRRTSSSSTKTAPAIGALKATASPAPAPDASKVRISGHERPQALPIRSAMTAPICTLGPSRPNAMPAPIANTPPENLTGISRGGAGGRSPVKAASTCGMPLPEA